MKRSTIFIILFISVGCANAQVNVEFYTGASGLYFRNNSLKTALNSYQDYWKNHGEPNCTIKTSNYNKELLYGINLLIDNGGVDYYILGFQHSYIKKDQIANLSFGKRHFKTTQYGNTYYFGIKKPNGISYKFGLGIMNCVLENSFEYPNGIISLGNEKLNNGVYASTINMNLNLELTKQKVFFGHLGVEGGVVVYGNVGGEYRDKSRAKFENFGLSMYRIIPQDYEAAQNAYQTGDLYYGKTANASSLSFGLILKAVYLLKSED